MDLLETDFAIAGRHPWELSRISSVKALLNDNLKSSIGLRFLDFGSGDAYVAAQLVAAYSEAKATCIDKRYTSSVIQQIMESYGSTELSFLTSSSELSDNDPSYDIVTMLDVLEHIEDPTSAVKELLQYGKFTNKTLFLVSVPAFNTLFTHHDTLLEHYTRYTVETLSQVLSAAGLVVKKTGYFNSSLLPIRFLEKMNEKFRGNKKTDTDISWDKPQLVTKLVTQALNLDAMTNFLLNDLGIKLPGLSCYALAQLI